jgi:hypothetical protein
MLQINLHRYNLSVLYTYPANSEISIDVVVATRIFIHGHVQACPELFPEITPHSGIHSQRVHRPRVVQRINRFLTSTIIVVDVPLGYIVY